jgi:hypothetical protein
MSGKILAVSLVLAGLLTAGALSATQAQAGHLCQDSIAGYLDRLKIAEDEVASLNVYSVKQKVGQPTGYNAWVSLKTCQGNLVINLSATCRVDDAYTRGDCRFEDVKPR